MKNKSKPSKDNKKLETSVIVAIIGVVGTIIATLISAYFNSKSQVTLISMQLTQTQLASIATETHISRTPTITNTFVVQETETMTPTIVKNSSTVVEYDLLSSYCLSPHAQIIPESKGWDGNKKIPSEVFENLLNSDSPKQIAPIWYNEPYEEFTLEFAIHNVSANWLKLENKVKFRVTPLQIEIPEQIHAFDFYQGCGGFQNKPFTDTVITLQTGIDEYEQSVSSPEYDFFTLQPDEYDQYYFSFLCSKPGVYQVSFQHNIEYQSKSNNVIQNDLPLIYCPKKMYLWAINIDGDLWTEKSYYKVLENSIQQVQVYLWNGVNYVEQ